MHPSDPARGTLAGCRILITRPAPRAAALARRLESLGARVFLRPTIRIVPVGDPLSARRALAALERYAWVVFTSVNGVERFFEFHEATGAGGLPAVAAIGRSTARALESRGVRPNMLPHTARSEDLARELADRVGPGTRLLLVQPEVARDVLPRALRAAGAVVDAVPFYRTRGAEDAPHIAEELTRDAFDVAVFTSPSTLRELLRGAREHDVPVEAALRRTANVAIGEVTAESLRRAGLPVAAVAEQADDAGLIDAILLARRP